jgi:hypothetical protein
MTAIGSLNRRRAGDAERCEQRGGCRHAPHRCERRLESAVEQDEHQRGGPRPIRELEVVERNAPDPLPAGGNPDAEKEERERDAEPLARATQHRAHGEQPPDAEKQQGRAAGLVHGQRGHASTGASSRAFPVSGMVT